MKPVTTITVLHANTKALVEVATDLIFAYYYSPASKSTYLVANGGAIIPVSESPEEIKQKLIKEIGETNGKN